MIGLGICVVALLSAVVALEAVGPGEAQVVDPPAAASESSAGGLVDSEPDPEPVASSVGGGGGPQPPVGADSVVRFDPATGQVETAIPVGAGLIGIEASEHALWALSADDGTITKIDAETDEILATIGVGGKPSGIAVRDGDDGVWVVNGGDAQIVDVQERPYEGDHLRDAFSVGRPPSVAPTGPTSLVSGDGAAWVATPTGRKSRTRVFRIDTSQKTLTAMVVSDSSHNILALGGGSLWVGDGDGIVRRLNPETLETIAEIGVGGQVAGMVWAGQALWVSVCDGSGGLIATVNPETDTPARHRCGLGLGLGSEYDRQTRPSTKRGQRQPSVVDSREWRPVDLAVTERGVYVALDAGSHPYR